MVLEKAIAMLERAELWLSGGPGDLILTTEQAAEAIRSISAQSEHVVDFTIRLQRPKKDPEKHVPIVHLPEIIAYLFKIGAECGFEGHIRKPTEEYIVLSFYLIRE